MMQPDHAAINYNGRINSNSRNAVAHSQPQAQMPLNVIIVGAGIAGLALASIMGDSGHRVLVLEAAPEIAEVGAGIYCSPNLTRLLSRWGLDDYIRKHTNSLTQINLRRWEHGELLGSAPLMPEVEKLHGAPQYVIHRADLHKALMAKAETVAKIRVNSMVTDIDFDKPSVVLSNGEVLAADVVIGADGSSPFSDIIFITLCLYVQG